MTKQSKLDYRVEKLEEIEDERSKKMEILFEKTIPEMILESRTTKVALQTELRAYLAFQIGVIVVALVLNNIGLI